MGEIKKRWYVVRAVSGKEKKVKEYLELEITRLKFDSRLEATNYIICTKQFVSSSFIFLSGLNDGGKDSE